MSRAKKITYRSKDVWKQRYHNYLIRYNRAKKSLERKGLTMFDRKSDFYDFKTKWEATFYDEREKMLSGDKKVIGDPTRYILEKQKFEGSYIQAQKMQRAFRRLKEDMLIDQRIKIPSISDIRARNIDPVFFNAIRNEYHSLRDFNGMEAEDAADAISEEFFGSGPKKR